MTATGTELQPAELCTASAETTRNRKTFTPRTDIYETENEVVLIADMPGIDENNVDITLEKNYLTIRGSVEPAGQEGTCLTYAEYSTGDYFRAFSVSSDLDRDAISATVKNGVLRLVLPKNNAAKARKSIPVRNG